LEWQVADQAVTSGTDAAISTSYASILGDDANFNPPHSLGGEVSYNFGSTIV
jgi:hypothetical protein